MLETIVIFALAGLLAGFLAGLLGIGGGFVVVPVLITVFTSFGLVGEHSVHMAIGTSLLTICATSIASARSHHRKGAVDWYLFQIIVPGLVIGTLLGAALAAQISGKALVVIFVSGAMLTAIYLMSGYQPTPHPSPKRWPFFSYGIFAGTISSLLGIGGGSVLVPFLSYKGKSMVQAVGTAAACGFPIALFGAAGYAITGWQAGVDVAYATGYLYWPAFAGIVVFSSLSAPWGAKLAHHISEKRLRQVFALFLFFTGAQILYSQWF